MHPRRIAAPPERRRPAARACRSIALGLGLVALFGTAAAAQRRSPKPEKIRSWSRRLDTGRQVVDRLVFCFDETSFLAEIGRWDRQRMWPVLLFEADLCDKFVSAFRPHQILLRRRARGGTEASAKERLARGLRAVLEAWGAAEKTATGSRRPPAAAPSVDAFRKALAALERAPFGVVLVAPGSPERLGGLALAAGRFHVPLVLETEKKHAARVTLDDVKRYRTRLHAAVAKLGVAFEGPCDDLDFVTVANDMPFGYTRHDPDAHRGGYTVDDALARHDDHTRWGWVGRLRGGPARSVYMAMCALFLQPERGLFFSRYPPRGRGGFGAFDPRSAPEHLAPFFPSDVIRHPDATLAWWRAHQWPRGNRYGFVFVNSSGGATSWSTSRGKATHFDVPDSVPCVVHYTHSGSAARPFDADTIAGRWLANGAYIYLGSYSEPYLSAFVPPEVLAQRVELGMPLGMAMRHFYTPRAWVRKPARKGSKRLVRFNVTAAWKLAYFGDPSYRLRRDEPARTAPEPRGRDYYPSVAAFLAARPRDAAARLRHAVASLGMGLLPGEERRLVNERAWRSAAGRKPPRSAVPALRLAMLRNFVARLRRAGPERCYATRELGKLARLPRSLEALMRAGARPAGKDARQGKKPGSRKGAGSKGTSGPHGKPRRGRAAPATETLAAARLLDELAKEYVAGLEAHPETDVGREPARALWVVELATRLEHSRGERKPFEAWAKEVRRTLEGK